MLAEREQSSVYTWVVDTNELVIPFYQKVGFKPTDVKQVLPSDKSLTEILYQLKLLIKNF